MTTLDRLTMHPQKIKAFARRVERLVEKMDSQEHQSLVDAGHDERIVHNNTLIRLTSVTSGDFNNLMAKLQSERVWRERFSESSLRSEVLGAIAARMSGEDAEPYAYAMAARLDAWQPCHRVWVPLSGVLLERDANFDFGRVSLVQMSELIFESEIASRLPQTVMVPGVTENVAYQVNVASDLDKAGLYATYIVETDAIRAAELADEYVAPVADFLQFCLASATSAGLSCIVDYKGRYQRRNVSTAVVVDQGSVGGLLRTLDDRTAARMTINQYNISHLSMIGVTQLAPLFGTPDIGNEEEYAQLLYTAIRVFAEGERSSSPRQKLLSYVTACEVFFSQKVESARAVTEGVAYVLGPDYDQRKAIKEAMEVMYAARSSATHVGLEPSDIDLYRRQVLEVLYHMIGMRKLEPEKFRTKGDLTSWVDRQRFSGPPVP